MGDILRSILLGGATVLSDLRLDEDEVAKRAVKLKEHINTLIDLHQKELE